MASFHNPNYSSGKFSCLSFSIMTTLYNPIKKLSTCTQFHHNMNSYSILICTFDGYNIRMTSQVVHYLNFSSHIFNIIICDKLPLCNRLTGILISCCLLHTQESCPELTLSKFSSKSEELLEIISFPLQHRINSKPCTRNSPHRTMFLVPLLPLFLCWFYF
ncbi:hypothetical protein V8G54_028326 [Vigna mungo]|uniref:Uncharacterized protein n=1 Tax=Vigna mungo TaxID=3915 RepID=A0AAQ3RLK6_VIGMU